MDVNHLYFILGCLDEYHGRPVPDLLRACGCTDLTVTYQPGGVPRVHDLSFRPTPEMAAWLGRARA